MWPHHANSLGKFYHPRYHRRPLVSDDHYQVGSLPNIAPPRTASRTVFSQDHAPRLRTRRNQVVRHTRRQSPLIHTARIARLSLCSAGLVPSPVIVNTILILRCTKARRVAQSHHPATPAACERKGNCRPEGRFNQRRPHLRSAPYFTS